MDTPYGRLMTRYEACAAANRVNRDWVDKHGGFALALAAPYPPNTLDGEARGWVVYWSIDLTRMNPLTK